MMCSLLQKQFSAASALIMNFSPSVIYYKYHCPTMNIHKNPTTICWSFSLQEGNGHKFQGKRENKCMGSGGNMSPQPPDKGF